MIKHHVKSLAVTDYQQAFRNQKYNTDPPSNLRNRQKNMFAMCSYRDAVGMGRHTFIEFGPPWSNKCLFSYSGKSSIVKHITEISPMLLKM